MGWGVVIVGTVASLVIGHALSEIILPDPVDDSTDAFADSDPRTFDLLDGNRGARRIYRSGGVAPSNAGRPVKTSDIAHRTKANSR